jgi:hypothetical protein
MGYHTALKSFLTQGNLLNAKAENPLTLNKHVWERLDR